MKAAMCHWGRLHYVRVDDLQHHERGQFLPFYDAAEAACNFTSSHTNLMSHDDTAPLRPTCRVHVALCLSFTSINIRICRFA